MFGLTRCLNQLVWQYISNMIWFNNRGVDITVPVSERIFRLAKRVPKGLHRPYWYFACALKVCLLAPLPFWAYLSTAMAPDIDMIFISFSWNNSSFWCVTIDQTRVSKQLCTSFAYRNTNNDDVSYDCLLIIFLYVIVWFGNISTVWKCAGNHIFTQGICILHLVFFRGGGGGSV